MNDRTPPHSTTAEIACSLDAGQLADRVDAWRQLTARVLTRRVQPGRVTSVYPRDDDLIDRLTQLIEAERDCCPFLRFTVREDRDVVHVDLEYPDGFEALLGSLLPVR